MRAVAMGASMSRELGRNVILFSPRADFKGDIRATREADPCFWLC